MSSSSPVQPLQSQLEALLPQTLDWLKRMVAINSFTTNPAGIDQMVTLTSEMFATLGFSSEVRASLTPSYGDHLFLERGPKDKPPILLVTHSDTVYPA